MRQTCAERGARQGRSLMAGADSDPVKGWEWGHSLCPKGSVASPTSVVLVCVVHWGKVVQKHLRVRRNFPVGLSKDTAMSAAASSQPPPPSQERAGPKGKTPDPWLWLPPRGGGVLMLHPVRRLQGSSRRQVLCVSSTFFPGLHPLFLLYFTPFSPARVLASL